MADTGKLSASFDADVKKYKNAYSDLLKAQKDLNHYARKYAENDPMNPKIINRAWNAIRKMNEAHRQRIALLRENDAAVAKLIKREEALIRELEKSGAAKKKSIAAERKLIAEEISRRGGYKTLLKTTASKSTVTADLLAGGLAGSTVSGGALFGLLAGQVALQVGMAVARAVGQFTIKNIQRGWEASRSEKQAALMAPGVFGSYSERKRDGSYVTFPGRNAGEVVVSQTQYLQNRKRDMYNPLFSVRNTLRITDADLMNAWPGLIAQGSRGKNAYSWMEDTQAATIFSKLGAFSEGSMQGIFRTAQRGGSTFGGRDLAELYAQAVSTGLEGARPEELLESLDNLMKAVQEVGANTDPRNLEQIIFRINATGNAATEGIRAGEIAIKSQNAMRNPGGGVAGKLLMLRAAGFGRGKSYGEAWRILQGSITEELFNEMVESVRHSDPIVSEMVASTWQGWSPTQTRAILKGPRGASFRGLNVEEMLKNRVNAAVSSSSVVAATELPGKLKTMSESYVQSWMQEVVGHLRTMARSYSTDY